MLSAWQTPSVAGGTGAVFSGTTGDDCLGDCRVEDVTTAPAAGMTAVGQCQATNSRFGCYTPVEDGKAGATICVD